MKGNGDIVDFIKKKSYVMLNNNLGSGSFGKTILLQDPSIDELFVAKKYEPEDSNDKEEFYSSFVQEIKIMHRLFHKNLVRIFNFYLYQEVFTGYILMEHIDGKSIDEYITEEYDELFNNDVADRVFIQLLDAFNFLEQNRILHRDIRENNILVDKDGVVKIIDFGLGKITHTIKSSKDSMDGVINRYNMAKHPKEFQDGKYTHQTDMFCIAELFERILAENNITDFRHSKILEKMTKPNAKDRYDSFQEIVDLIGEKQFEMMNVDDEDKAIYQRFSNAIYQKINHYSGEKKFETNIDKIAEKLKAVIEQNSLETYIQLNQNLISVFVLSAYNYKSKEDILCYTVTNFYMWFMGLSAEYKKTVVNNLTIKLSKIHTITEPRDPLDDLPF